MEYKKKILQIKTDSLRSKYNSLSKLFGLIKKISINIRMIKLQILNIKRNLLIQNEKLKLIQNKLKNFLLSIPNITDSEVPIGKTDKDNYHILYWGKIKNFHFPVKDHVFLGEKHSGFDWLSAIKMSGTNFVIIKGKIALLYRALGQFMIDIHTLKHNYLEICVPYLVNKNSMYGTGQLPKFKDDLFYVFNKNQLNKKNKHILIPTSEVPLTNLFRNIILKESELPVMLTAYSPCFRSEGISYGQDARGLMRMHQFDKVEIFQINSPKNSMASLEQLTFHAETILRLLNLPYRKVLLCTQEMSFSSSKTYDLEVWFPGQNKYREVSSCSNLSDFQARRINIRYLKKSNKEKKLVHTINGSGLAIGRILAAILENYQQIDGSIKVPKVLRKKYMNGIKLI